MCSIDNKGKFKYDKKVICGATGGTSLKRYFLYILLVFTLISFLPVTPVSADARQVVVFTLDRVTLEEWVTNLRMPHLRKLMNESSLGLVSLRTVGPLTPDKVYAMIGAGGVIPAGIAATWAYDANEMIGSVTAAQVYRRLYKHPSLKGPVHLGLAKLKEQMEEEYSYQNGELGRILHAKGFRTSIVGNCDALNRPNRSGVTMVMDRYGRVDMGLVSSEILMRDPGFPMGLRTDYERMFQEYQSYSKKAALTLLVSGDLERLEIYRKSLSDAALARARVETLRRCDALLGRMIQDINWNSTLFILLVTAPPDVMVQAGERMSPILIRGSEFQRGLVYSYSTRQKGLVTPADVTSTIVQFLCGNTPTAIDGRPLKAVDENAKDLVASHRFWANNYQQRWPILTAYAYLMIILTLAGLAGIFFYRRRWFQDAVRSMLRLVMGVPLAFLWVSMINPYYPLVTAGLTLIFSVGLAFLIDRYLEDERLRLMAVCLLTTLTIMVDLLTGTHLLRSSMLSYSVMVGARFYGLGNEYMGAFLGAFLMGVSGFFDLFPQKFRRLIFIMISLSMVGVTWLIMHPAMGANVGGGLSAVIGFGTAMLIFAGRKIRWRNLAVLMVSVLFVLALMGYIDYRTGYGNTHLGQNIRLISANGLTAIWQIITRKWRMNMGLVFVTPWARVLVLFLLTVPLLFRRPPGVLQRIFTRYPSFARGLGASIITAFAALVLNDSGIVAAATAMIYGGISLLCVVLQEVSPPNILEKDEKRFGGVDHGDQGLSHL